MSAWIFQSSIDHPLVLLATNTTLYKWLLGGGIILMAILGLVFFGMLALMVLRQEEPASAVSSEETPKGAECGEDSKATESAEEAVAPVAGGQEE